MGMTGPLSLRAKSFNQSSRNISSRASADGLNSGVAAVKDRTGQNAKPASTGGQQAVKDSLSNFPKLTDARIESDKENQDPQLPTPTMDGHPLSDPLLPGSSGSTGEVAHENNGTYEPPTLPNGTDGSTATLDDAEAMPELTAKTRTQKTSSAIPKLETAGVGNGAEPLPTIDQELTPVGLNGVTAEEQQPAPKMDVQTPSTPAQVNTTTSQTQVSNETGINAPDLQATTKEIRDSITNLLDGLDNAQPQNWMQKATSASVAKYTNILLRALDEQAQSGQITQNQLKIALNSAKEKLETAAKYADADLSTDEAAQMKKEIMPGKNNIGGIKDILQEALKASAKETGNKPKISFGKRFIAFFKGKKAEDLHFAKLAKKIVKQTRNDQLDKDEWKMHSGTSARGNDIKLGYMNDNVNKGLTANIDGESKKIINKKAAQRGVTGKSSQGNLDEVNKAGNNLMSSIGKYSWGRHSALITSPSDKSQLAKAELGTGLTKSIGLEGNMTAGEVVDTGNAEALQKFADTLMPDGANTATKKTKSSINKLIDKLKSNNEKLASNPKNAGKLEKSNDKIKSQLKKKLGHLTANRNKAKDLANNILTGKLATNPNFAANMNGKVSLFVTSSSMLSPCLANSVFDKGYGEPEKLQEQNRSFASLETLTKEEQAEILGDFETEDGQKVFGENPSLEMEVATFNHGVNELKGMGRGAEKAQNMEAFDKLMGKIDNALKPHSSESSEYLDIQHQIAEARGKLDTIIDQEVNQYNGLASQDKIETASENKTAFEASKGTGKIEKGMSKMENMMLNAIDDACENNADLPEGFDRDTAIALRDAVVDAQGFAGYIKSDNVDDSQFQLLSALYDNFADSYTENSEYREWDNGKKGAWKGQSDQNIETITDNFLSLSALRDHVKSDNYEQHASPQFNSIAEKSYKNKTQSRYVKMRNNRKLKLQKQIKSLESKASKIKDKSKTTYKPIGAAPANLKVVAQLRDKFAQKFNDLYGKGKDTQENPWMLPVYETVITVVAESVDDGKTSMCALANCKSGKDRTGEWDAKVKEMLDQILTLPEDASDGDIKAAVGHFEALVDAQAFIEKHTANLEGETVNDAADNIKDPEIREQVQASIQMLDHSFNNLNASGNKEALFNTSGAAGFKLKGHFGKRQDADISKTYGMDKNTYKSEFIGDSKMVSS